MRAAAFFESVDFDALLRREVGPAPWRPPPVDADLAALDATTAPLPAEPAAALKTYPPPSQKARGGWAAWATGAAGGRAERGADAVAADRKPAAASFPGFSWQQSLNSNGDTPPS